MSTAWPSPFCPAHAVRLTQTRELVARTIERGDRADGVVWLVDFGGVDARHDAVGGEAEASQLLGRQDVDDQ